MPAASQPAAVYDPHRKAVFLFYRGGLSGYANAVGIMRFRDNATQWDPPGTAGGFALGPCPGLPPPAPATCVGVAPGPGNALVLSAAHPVSPSRILIPVWLDFNVRNGLGAPVSAVFFSDGKPGSLCLMTCCNSDYKYV